MHRTTPVVTNTPSVSQTYRTAILSEFKGIDETVNPFSAVKNSAKECTNLYIDDEGTLVTRPRVEFVETLPTNERYYKTFKLYDKTQKWFWVSVYLKPFEVCVKDSVASEFKNYTVSPSIDIEEPTFFHNDQNKFVIGSKADGTSVLYVATFDFNSHKINLKEPTYYLPTSQLYDIESDSYYALNEQANLWTSASAATMYWSLKTISNPVYRKRDLKIIKNEYYDSYKAGSGVDLVYTDDFLLYDHITQVTRMTGTSTTFDCRVWFADKTTKSITTDFSPADLTYDPEYDLFIYTSLGGGFVYFNDDIMVDIPAIGIKTDIRNKILCVVQNARHFHIYSYSKNKTITKLAEFKFDDDAYYDCTTFDSIHHKLYMLKMVGANSRAIGGGYIDFSDLDNIKRVTSDSFDNNPVDRVYYYDVINNITYVETQKNVRYSIDKDGVATEQKYFSNFGTNDSIEIDTNGHQLIHLNPEGKIFDNGKIIDYDYHYSGFTYISINDNLLTHFVGSESYYVISKYKSDTAQPLLYIDMPIEADPPKHINRVSRFNNNFVFWSTKSNTVYFTRYNDPTYIPTSYYEAYGGANGVKGVLRISDEYLAVLKEDQAYITWTKDNLFYSNELRVNTGCSQEEACIVCNYSNLPIMVNNDGVWSLGQSSSVNYQDTVFGSISDRIDKGFTEYLPDKYILHNHKYYTYIGYNRDESGIIWMYDNRINMWFKWVLPITITDFIEIDDVTYIVSTYSNKHNELYRLDPYGKQVDDDVQYLDEVHRTNPRYINITWKWVSQPLPFNTLNFKKRIKYLKLIFANKYESDHITFKYWFRTYTQTEYPTNPRTYTAEITTLKTQKLKPRIPKFDFLQIILESNNDSDQFEDGVGDTVSTTLNDKIGFVSIALNYLLLEG